MRINEFLSLLNNVKKSGSGWTARCPAHDDEHNSLSVSEKDGKILLHCFAGCDIRAIVQALGLEMKDLFLNSAPYRGGPARGGGGITIESLAADKRLPVDFLRSLGVVQDSRFVKITYLLEDGSPAPRQRIRTALRAKDGSKWAKGDGKPVPYGLWRLAEAREAGYLVLVEGESDCWTLWYHGFPALGIPGADMTEKLKLEHVKDIPRLYVVREPDKGGDTFAAGIAKRLAGWKTWQGEAYEVRLTGAKDPNDLHKQNPDELKAKFQAALDAAEPLQLPAPVPEANKKTDEQPSGEHLTDLGNARRLVARYGQDLRYCHPWGKWLVWTGKGWKVDETGAVLRLAKETVRNIYAEAAAEPDEKARQRIVDHALRSESAGRIKAMVALAESEPGIPVLPAELDRDPWLLNVLNGTIDLRTGELRPHRREDMLTKIAPVEYDPQAKCPRWEQFLNEIMDGNRNLMGFLQRAVGMSLTGDTSEHVLFILHGSGRNGKSTFLNTLLALLGDYGMTAAPDLLMAKQNDRHPTELADLFGKRLVVSIESDEGRRLAESLIKQLTGGDKIKARRMREDFWEFSPSHKLWLATNHKPRVRGTDVAIWSRLKLIPFAVTFPEDKQDKQLAKKLLAELPGILRWAVEGCLTWQRDGLGVPEEVKAATESYRQEQDVLAAFLNECCIINPLAKVAARNLYKAYVDWCGENGEHPLAQRNFGMRLAERGFVSKKGTAGRYFWEGIGLRESGVSGPSGVISGINKSFYI
ncbi:phage/plasmid primase, P4 family [Desulfofundulus kuznetsovii DSM 6115]|uniref:Phage/plasmid primase, P4 family n=1 Tax=Desulfofundulus kuznetsovii (strain DSM 6115 / VKM B-1805 / 17) TaxID=760568 RepID=A0AAU8PAM0_DESK7|nr:phage/plasmid primase, P4 family [Desulfofundulus kuznetsovii DSM 6115]